MLLLVLILLLAGCATVLKRELEPIAVDSQPAGADARIDCAGGTRGAAVTPGHVIIPRSADGCVLTISKQGYAMKTMRLERGYNGAYWSNFALLPGLTLAAFLSPPTDNEDRIARAAAAAAGISGVLGFFVDRQNGRGYRHFPDEIKETLEPVR